MRLALELSHDEIQDLQYPVVVERWHIKSSGKVKREWLEQFNETERKQASKIHNTFSRWYLQSGAPQHIKIRPETLQLMKKLIHFFATA